METVGVLSDLHALAEATAWRRRGRTRRLIAGPNLVVLPSDARSLMTAPEIDLCIVPSDWVRRLYEEDAPELAGRIAVWPAGVDADYWRPSQSRADGGHRALIYRKELPGQRGPRNSEVRSAHAALERAGFTVATLTYGSFGHDRYRRALQEADLMVFFSPTESQCLALVEAWSTDVPSFVWSRDLLAYRGRVYKASSAPYLSSETGRKFEDTYALERLLERWDELQPTFRPREWVLGHMTDAISARAYWDLAHPGR